MDCFPEKKYNIEIITVIGDSYDDVLAKFHEVLERLHGKYSLETLLIIDNEECRAKHNPDVKMLFRYDVDVLPRGIEVYAYCDTDIEGGQARFHYTRKAYDMVYSYVRNPHNFFFLEQNGPQSFHDANKHVLADLKEKASRKKLALPGYQ